MGQDDGLVPAVLWHGITVAGGLAYPSGSARRAAARAGRVVAYSQNGG